MTRKVFKVSEGKILLKEPLDHKNICNIYEKVMELVIPNSLAEERFENLQLEAFFKGTLDLLVSFEHILESYNYISSNLFKSKKNL